MKGHIGVDSQSGLVHTVTGTAAHVGDVTETAKLLHGEETEVFWMRATRASKAGRGSGQTGDLACRGRAGQAESDGGR